MKRFLPIIKTNILVIVIVLIAIVLRFHSLNKIPHGLYWDEAAITYNAWGIAVWNRDEWGIKLPLSFKSFGDYKAPLVIYVLGIIYKLTGLEISYLRLLVAVAGVANVVLIFAIAKSLRPKNQWFAWASAAIMAILPWAVHFSRIGSEATVALALTLLGIFAAFHQKWYVAAVSLGLSLYAYHSPKVFLPFFSLVTLLLFRGSKVKNRFHLVGGVIIFILICLPFVYDNLYGDGFERGKSLIFFSQGTVAPVAKIVAELTTNITSYISPSFWFFGHDKVGLRHGVPGSGNLYWSVGVFMLLGLWRVAKERRRRQLFVCLWTAAGMMPALLSEGNPHAIRSMMALPPLVLLAAEGFTWLKTKKQALALLIMVVMAVELGLYLRVYYGEYARESAVAFQYGYREAIATAQEISSGKDTIVVTSEYGQPYIYTLLYRKLTPEEFKFGALANYEFHPITWPDPHPNRVFVATPQEISPTDPAVVKTITIPNSDIPVFVIAKNGT
jgi:4-amino-4-deoxy-L-arabinose transferase-like glycosyltransferase